MNSLDIRRYKPPGKAIECMEYFIDEKPLSEHLKNLNKTNVFDKWISAFSIPSNVGIERLKAKHLMNKRVSDDEIRRLYDVDENIEWHVQKHREELNNSEVLLYCCAECGDYDCGGIATEITFTDKSIIWFFGGETDPLTFEFDKFKYFSVFNRFLR